MDINHSLVYRNVDCRTSDEVLDYLSNQLLERGYALEGYAEALKQREAAYPTGLAAVGESVAIPHADSDYVQHDAVAVALLKRPVIFYCMDRPDQALEVQIVIMLAISEPHGQLEMLQRVVNLVQNESLRYQLVHHQSDQDIHQLIQLLKGED